MKGFSGFGGGDGGVSSGSPDYMMNGFSGFGNSNLATKNKGADPEAAKTLSWANNVRRLQGLRPLVGSLLAAGGLATLGFFGRSSNGKQGTEISSPVGPQLYEYADPPLPSIDDYGGAKDAMLSRLTSVSNRENRDGAVPRVYGKKVRFFPPIAAHPFPSVVATTQTLSGVLECGPGPLKLESVQIDTRPASEFVNKIQFGYQYGKADDTALQFYKTDVENVEVNERLISSPDAKTKRAGQVATRLAINICFPNGLYSRNAQGQIGSASVSFYIFARNLSTGGYVFNEYPVVTAAQTSPVFYYKEWAVEEALYDVSIQRQVISPESTDPNLVNESHWTDLVAWADGEPFLEIKNSLGQLVRMARLEFRATSSVDFDGAVGQISVAATSELPEWNGTTWSAPVDCNNPAWIITSMLKEPANYRPCTDDQIDLPSFLAFSEWCIANNFTYNKVVEDMTVEEACSEVAAAGRANFIKRNGKYSIVIDRTQDTIAQHFTPRNIIAGSFSMDGKFIDPPDFTEVQWVNPLADWMQDKRDVYDDGKVKGVDLKNDTLTLPGVTDKDVVYKLGRYYLAQNRLRTETYKFSADIEHIRCEYGDRIRLTHDRLGIGLGQGRITALTLNGSNDITGITIDAAQTMITGTSYELTIRTSKGGSLVCPVTTVQGYGKSFTLITPIAHDATDKPQKEDLVSFGELGASTRDLLIISKEPKPDLSAEITCVDYAPEVYLADAGPIPEYKPLTTRPRRIDVLVPLPQVLNVRSDENVLDRQGDGSLKTRILVTIGAVTQEVDRLEWQIKPVESSQWSASSFVSPSANGGAFSVYDVEDGRSYDLQVRARIGNWFGAWNTSIQNHKVIGKTTPPPPVPPIVDREPNSTFIKWFYDSQHGVNVPLDFAGFRIKFAWGAYSNWEQGYTLVDLTSSTRFDFGGLAKGIKTIMIKAVDVAGNEQAEAPAMLQLDFGDVEDGNIILSTEHAPLFNIGTRTNCSVSGSNLVSDDNGTLFWGDDNAPFWGADGDLFWDVQYIPGTYTWRYTPPSTERKPFKIKVPIVASGPYQLEYRTFGNTLFWGPDNENFWGADDDLFWDTEDPPFQPVPDDGIVGDWIEYEFRLTLLGGASQVVVSSLKHSIDVVDLIEYVDDLAVTSSGGTRAPLTNIYRGIKSVNATLQQSPLYPNARGIQVLDKSSAGPLIQVIDSAGAGTTGLVDLIIRGY